MTTGAPVLAYCRYRMYAGDGMALYIGASRTVFSRIAHHMSTQHWAREVSRIQLDWYPSRAALAVAERAAIEREAPIYNTAGVTAPHGRYSVPEPPPTPTPQTLTRPVPPEAPGSAESRLAVFLVKNRRDWLTLREITRRVTSTISPKSDRVGASPRITAELREMVLLGLVGARPPRPARGRPSPTYQCQNVVTLDDLVPR